jgi:hypothetical protein
MKTPNKIIKYRGFFITRLFPSGYYETYLGEGLGFFKADTLQGIKNQIRLISQ